MNRQTMTPERKEVFSRLLDDPAIAVRAALLAEFTELGSEAIGFLREIVQGPDRVLGLHASWYLRQLKFRDPVEEFTAFIHSLQYELETGALLLNRTVMPELEVGECCRLLDEIARRCLELMVSPISERQKCRVINRVLFHEYGFRGNIEHYTDPQNSLLSEVLRSRRGLPITLSIVYILVADRCGLDLLPVGLPGHFLVGCYGEGPVFFIDPFARGAFRSPEDVFEHLRSNKIKPRRSDLTPTPVREVLARCCTDLARHYSIQKETRLADLFTGFVHEFEEAYKRNINS